MEFFVLYNKSTALSNLTLLSFWHRDGIVFMFMIPVTLISSFVSSFDPSIVISTVWGLSEITEKKKNKKITFE